MKIIFLKKRGKNSILTLRLLLMICLVCLVFSSYLILNQPVAPWQEPGAWQVKVYQKADHMMSPTPTWICINELHLTLTREESGETPWCLEVKDNAGKELLPGITRLLIYYSDDLLVTDGWGLDQENRKIMGISEFFALSLYGEEFFTPHRKRYHNLRMFVQDRVKVELSEYKGENAWWDKEHPWWIIYENNKPPLKAEFTSMN
ncbi:MAG: hypothetical protein ACOX47_07735 [Bacillota bacterium]|jgi:hypothetical protein